MDRKNDHAKRFTSYNAYMLCHVSNCPCLLQKNPIRAHKILGYDKDGKKTRFVGLHGIVSQNLSSLVVLAPGPATFQLYSLSQTQLENSQQPPKFFWENFFE